jgi:hypothetical protein
MAFPKQVYRLLARHGGADLHALLAATFSLVVYLLTLSPTIVKGDSPELVSAAYQLGVPHPTGYPLYMLLSHLAIRCLPFGDPAYRVNVLSAALAAGAVGVAHRLTVRFTGSIVAGWAAALVLASAPLFWEHATSAEVYALASLLALLLLDLIRRWDETGDLRFLSAAALVTGLNLCHHLSISLLAPGLIGYALTSRHRSAALRRLPLLVLLMLLPLLFYLYLPIRALADPQTNWGDARTLAAALRHATGGGYSGAFFAALPEDVRGRVRDLPTVAVSELGWAGCFLAIAGIVFLLTPAAALAAGRLSRRGEPASEELQEISWERWRLGCMLLPWGILSLVWGTHYGVFDYTVFYQPALVVASLLAGLGAAGVQRLAPPSPRPARPVIAGLLIAATAGPIVGRWEANDHHRDWSELEYARRVATSLPQRALVFGNHDYDWFGFLYLQAVEGARPDVLLLNVWETRRPRAYRLIARYRGPSFAVPSIPGFGAPGQPRSEFAFLGALVEENIRQRPVCFLTNRDFLNRPDIRSMLSRYQMTVYPGLPLFIYRP